LTTRCILTIGRKDCVAFGTPAPIPQLRRKGSLANLARNALDRRSIQRDESVMRQIEEAHRRQIPIQTSRSSVPAMLASPAAQLPEAMRSPWCDSQLRERIAEAPPPPPVERRPPVIRCPGREDAHGIAGSTRSSTAASYGRPYIYPGHRAGQDDPCDAVPAEGWKAGSCLFVCLEEPRTS